VIVVGGFNTALDKLAEIDAIDPGAVLRLRNVRTLPGGKGLHVALACATLGTPATLVGLIDEGTRELFENTLANAGGKFVGVKADAPIRTCYALRDASGRTTELLEAGPDVAVSTATALLDAFRQAAASADFIVLSGSLPPGLPLDTYSRLSADIGETRVLLDSSGPALAAGIAAGPMLVKPNRQEAEQLVGFGIASLDDAARAAAAIGARGPRYVVLSLGAEGAMVRTSEKIFFVRAPAVTARNTVGAGDCLLAGFAIGFVRRWPIEQCARYAVACGTAKVMHPETGMLLGAEVEELMRAVSLIPLAA
jgi:1-phosphofructokinase family hexose kinase